MVWEVRKILTETTVPNRVNFTLCWRDANTTQFLSARTPAVHPPTIHGFRTVGVLTLSVVCFHLLLSTTYPMTIRLPIILLVLSAVNLFARPRPEYLPPDSRDSAVMALRAEIARYIAYSSRPAN